MTLAGVSGQIIGSLLIVRQKVISHHIYQLKAALLKWKPAEEIIPYYMLVSGLLGLLVCTLLVEYPDDEEIEKSKNIKIETLM